MTLVFVAQLASDAHRQAQALSTAFTASQLHTAVLVAGALELGPRTLPCASETYANSVAAVAHTRCQRRCCPLRGESRGWLDAVWGGPQGCQSSRMLLVAQRCGKRRL